MRGLVFGFEPGDLHRAGRSERSLVARGVVPDGPPVFDARALAHRLAESRPPLLLLRAGAWFAGKTPLEPFPASATGRMLAGIGAVRHRSAHDIDRDALAAEWSRWLNWSGGDPQHRGRFMGEDIFCNLLSRCAVAWRPRRLPKVASCYLDVPAARTLAGYLETNQCFDDAIRRLLHDRRTRVVHLSELDTHSDAACRVIQLVTTIQIGGAERVTLDLAEELIRQGLRVCVAALSAPTRLAFQRPAIFADLSGAPRSPKERAKAVAELARDFGADLIHAHLIRAEEGRAIKAEGLPLVMTVHNSQPGWPSGLAEASRDATDFLFACAQSVEGELVARELGIPVRTVWNGINPEPFLSTVAKREVAVAWRGARGWGVDDLVLVALANPRPQKQLHLLPEIVHELQLLLGKEERREVSPTGVDDFKPLPQSTSRLVRLVIVGAHSEGSAEARASVAATEEEIEKWGVEDQVLWTGGVEDVATILTASDALISVSAYEGLSLAHLEALAAGTPVVATAVGGAGEIANQSSAMRLLAPEASVKDFAEAIFQVSQKQDGKTSSLPVSFHRRHMAARARRLYPRVIECARGLGAGEEIWLITNNFSTGGAQSSARRLLVGLAACGHKVRAFTVQELAAHPTLGRSALLRAGIPVMSISPPEVLDAADAASQILEIAARMRPRVVLFWNLIASYKILLADGLIDVPIYDVSPGGMYYTSLTKYFAQPRPGLPYLSPREYGARLAGVVVKYAGEAQDAAQLGAPVVVIRNGVACSDSATRKEPGERTRLVIGTAARISPDKRIEDLIAALRIAHSRLPKYVLRIAGGVERGADHYARELRKQARGLRIEWLGELPGSQQFLAGLDIFAMISEPAGCPNASLEAMAAELPVIATDVGGASEQVIDGGNGRLLPKGDAAGFAAALIELGNVATLRSRMGEAGAAHVRAHFSLEAMITNYERLCGHGTPGFELLISSNCRSGAKVLQ